MSLFKVVLIIPRMVNKCLGRLVGISPGLIGEVMVLGRVISLVGGYLESIWGAGVSPFVLVILGPVGCLNIRLHVGPGH